MEKGFAYMDQKVKGIRWDAKYATCDNFTGEPVDGYSLNRIVGTLELCDAVARATEKAQAMGYGLLLWDGYRPQRAVQHFLRWAKLPEDNATKQRHYPNIDKADMVRNGYVAEKSGHSRGSAIDLTLYRLEDGALLPMGSGFDFMDEISHHGAKGVDKMAADNRMLLRSIMESCGFVPYECEWWHYSLQNEPYPDTYFDFPVE